MKTQCSNCQAVFNVKDEYVNRNAACAKCGQTFIMLPFAETPPTETASSAISAGFHVVEAPPIRPPAGMNVPSPYGMVSPPPIMQHGYHPFVSPGLRANLVLFFLLLWVVFIGLSIWSTSSQINLLHRIQDNGVKDPKAPYLSKQEAVPMTEITANDERQQVFSLGWVGAMLVALTFFWIWKYRAYKNLYSMNACRIRFSPGGAVGWYFCPIVNLWKPFQAMADIWVGSNPRNVRQTSQDNSAAPVVVWWAMWIISSVSGNIATRLSLSEDIDGLLTGSYAMIISDAVDVVFLLVMAGLILRITNNQLRRNKFLNSEPVYAAY